MNRKVFYKTIAIILSAVFVTPTFPVYAAEDTALPEIAGSVLQENATIGSDDHAADAEETENIIVSFSPIAPEILNQTVSEGVYSDMLDLPSVLEAGIIFPNAELASDTDMDGSESTSGAAIQIELSEEINGVIWRPDTEYTGLPGIYIFTPILPDGYALGEDAALPEITVVVEEIETERSPIMPDLSGFYMPTPIRDKVPLPDSQADTSFARNAFSRSGGLANIEKRRPSGFPGQFDIPDGAEFVPVGPPKASRSFTMENIGDTERILEYSLRGHLDVMLAAKGEKAYVWVDTDLELSPNAEDFLPDGTTANPFAQEIADEFDSVIYDLVVNGTGNFDEFDGTRVEGFTGLGEPLYPEGGNGKINIVMYSIPDAGGYFTGTDYSTYGNMDANIYINADEYKDEDAWLYLHTAVAHEFGHLVNYSHYIENVKLGALTIADNDSEAALAPYRSTWLEEGATVFIETLYSNLYGYPGNTLFDFVTNSFMDDIGYVPTRPEWETAFYGGFFGNYGASGVLAAEFAAAKLDLLDELFASPWVGYIYSKELVGELYGGGFDDFFTVAMLNTFVDTPLTGENDPPIAYTSAVKAGNWGHHRLFENMWEYMYSSLIYSSWTGYRNERLFEVAENDSLTFDTEGRRYYSQIFIAKEAVGADNSSVQIAIPDEAEAEYYIVTPYFQTDIDETDEWIETKKQAARLNPGENAVTVGTNNKFAVIAIAYEDAADEELSYEVMDKDLATDGRLALATPASGETPVSFITGNGQYSGEVSWNPADASFQNGSEYTAVVTLTPESGFTFEGLRDGFFSAENAVSADVTGYDNESGEIEIEVTFLPVGETPEHKITLNGDGDFSADRHADSIGKDITVTNEGNLPTGPLTLAIEGDDAFALSARSLPALSPGDEITVTVRPKTALSGGEYNSVLHVSGKDADDDLALSLELTADNSYAPVPIIIAPKGVAEAPEELALKLEFDTDVTVVPGKRICIIASQKKSNNDPLSDFLYLNGYIFLYEIPEDFSSIFSGRTLTVPLSEFKLEDVYLTDFMAADDYHDAYRKYSVVVESSGFLDSVSGKTLRQNGFWFVDNGPGMFSYDIDEFFYSKFSAAPHVDEVTPSNAAADVPAGGNIELSFIGPSNGETKFPRPMDKSAGTVTLTPSSGAAVSLSGGVWSADASKLTVPYEGLRPGVSYTVGLEGFKDIDGNELAVFSSIFTVHDDESGNGGNDNGNDSGGNSGGGSGGGGSSLSSSTSQASGAGNATILVDGKATTAGSVTKSGNTAAVTVNQAAFDRQIESAEESVAIVMPDDTVNGKAQLLVKNINDMTAKELDLTVQLGKVSYNIPAASVDTAALLRILGATDPSRVTFSIEINTDVRGEVRSLVERAILSNGLELVSTTLEFRLSASYNGKMTEVTAFSRYVPRTAEVTEAQAGRITSAVVVDKGDTVRHIPTRVYSSENKWYAEINSLTNSTYAFVYNEESFTDARGKWYEEAVNEMAGRIIISGVGGNMFAGEREVTRAEFSSIIVRALGLPANGNVTAFNDVQASEWYAEAVGTAYNYGIVNGRGGGVFDPESGITWQEAMIMIRNAAKISGLEGLSVSIAGYSDASYVSDWAKDSVEFYTGSGLFVHGGRLRPMDKITRAETAAAVLKLLQKSGLVDVRS